MRLFLSSLVAGSVLMVTLVAARGDEPTPACPNCKKAVAVSARGNYGPPFTCPLWPFLVLSNGTMYYCDYFPTACTDEPDVAFLVGDLSYPCECGVEGTCCQGVAFMRGNNIPYPGMVKPVPAGFVYQLPVGRAREFGKVLVDPSFSFVKFDANDHTIYAKVFTLSLDTEGAASGIPTNEYKRTIYLALESKEQPADAMPVSPVALDPESAKGRHFIYKAKVTLPSGEKRLVMILAAR